MAWILYELARSPSWQERIRSEIWDAHSCAVNQELSYSDFETMTCMNSFIKVRII